MKTLLVLLPVLLALGVRAPNGGAMPCWMPEASCSECPIDVCPVDVCPIVLDCVPPLASACSVRWLAGDEGPAIAPAFTLDLRTNDLVTVPPADAGLRDSGLPLWLRYQTLLL